MQVIENLGSVGSLADGSLKLNPLYDRQKRSPRLQGSPTSHGSGLYLVSNGAGQPSPSGSRGRTLQGGIETSSPSDRKSLLPGMPPPVLAPLTSSELENLALHKENTTGMFGKDSQVQSANKDIEEKAVFELASHRGDERSKDLKNSAASLFEEHQNPKDSSQGRGRPQQVSRLRIEPGGAEEGFLLDSSLREDAHDLGHKSSWNQSDPRQNPDAVSKTESQLEQLIRPDSMSDRIRIDTDADILDENTSRNGGLKSPKPLGNQGDEILIPGIIEVSEEDLPKSPKMWGDLVLDDELMPTTQSGSAAIITSNNGAITIEDSDAMRHSPDLNEMGSPKDGAKRIFSQGKLLPEPDRIETQQAVAKLPLTKKQKEIQTDIVTGEIMTLLFEELMTDGLVLRELVKLQLDLPKGIKTNIKAVKKYLGKICEFIVGRRA